MVDYPKDTILKLEFPKVELRRWDKKYYLYFAFTLSNDWMVRIKEGWVSVGVDRVREAVREASDRRLKDILDVKKVGKGGGRFE